MNCLDEKDDLKLWGNYDTSSARNLMIVFEKCDNATMSSSQEPCKSEEIIAEWMKFKYIFVYMNEFKFVPHKFEDDRISLTSGTRWVPLNPTERMDTVYKVTRSKLKLKDSYMLGSLAGDEYDGFSLNQLPGRTMQYLNSF